MADLKVHYFDKNNRIHFASYKTIMEFTEYIEANPNDPIKEGVRVKAQFFENCNRIKEFDTIADLYSFCLDILK